MKYTRVLLLMALFIGLLVVGCSSVDDDQQNPVISEVQDNNNGNVMDDDQLVAEALGKLAKIQTEAEATEILNIYPENIRDLILKELDCGCDEQEPQSSHPAALTAINQLGLLPEEIIAVQMMVLSPDGPSADTIFAVVTNDQWYYVDQNYQSVLKSNFASKALTTEVDIYGSSIDKVSGLCLTGEWVVVFYMPVCFYELWIGKFDGILDAWAPDPPCGQYNGGICALWQCGSAWTGAGNEFWYNYHTCGDPRASTKVGKIVQKRWLFTWRNSGRSDSQIAASVRARIRY